MPADISPDKLGVVLRADELEMQDEIKSALLEAAVEGAELLAERAPHAFGELRSSIHAKRTAQGAEIRIDAPHSAFIELGTRPHTPPIEPLKRWARKKLGDENAAYAIQKKIAKEGTRPQPFVRDSLAELSDITDRVIRERLG